MPTTYVFKKIRDPNNEFDNYDATFVCNAETLPDIIECFEDFLKGAGFHLKGRLEMVDINVVDFPTEEENNT